MYKLMLPQQPITAVLNFNIIAPTNDFIDDGAIPIF